MSANKDKNHVSFGLWFLLLFLTALPCIGWAVILIGAFVGENESIKNYCRAVIAWFVLIVLLGIVLMLLGFGLSMLQEMPRHF